MLPKSCAASSPAAADKTLRKEERPPCSTEAFLIGWFSLGCGLVFDEIAAGELRWVQV